MAFSKLKNGLAAEVRNQMAALGSMLPMCAPWLLLSGLKKWNVSAFLPPGPVSSLQQLCSRYSSVSKLLGKHEQTS